MSERLDSTNGRWTKEEHEKFLLGSFCPDVGLEVYGKNWKKIEEIVQTRNGSQIRSHAQKFFLKLQKQKKTIGDGELNISSHDSHDTPTVISRTTESKKQSSS